MEYLGNYQLKAKIVPGGAWANVFIAEKDNKEYIVKVLKKSHSERTATIRDFFKEANLLKGIGHPNIVKVYDIGPYNQPPYYFSMEYYSKGNLDAFIRERGQLQDREVIFIAAEVCKALDYLNSKGHMHLDLKPSNILFSTDNQVVVSDFGSSINLKDTGVGITLTGTPQFMSPEQFDEAGKLSFATDLYSLGIMMYEMVTGQLPFQGDSMQQLSVLHSTVKPFPPSQFNSNVSKELEKVILKLLEKKPQDRFQSARELQTKLDSVLEKMAKPARQLMMVTGAPGSKMHVKKKIASFPASVEYISSPSPHVVIDKQSASPSAVMLDYSPASGITLTIPEEVNITAGKKRLSAGKHAFGSDRCYFEINAIPVSVTPHHQTFWRQYIVGVILLLGLSAGGLYFGMSAVTRPLLISNLKINPSELTIDEDIRFSVSLSEEFTPYMKYQIKPYRDRGDVRTLNRDLINLYDEGFRDLENEQELSVRIIDEENNRQSNWLYGRVSFKRITESIRLRNILIPSAITVATPVQVTLDYISAVQDGNLKYDFQAETAGRVVLRKYENISQKTFPVILFDPGEYELRARIIDTVTSEVSNFIVHNVMVSPKAPELKIRSFSFNNSILDLSFDASGFSLSGSEKYYIVINGKSTHVNPAGNNIQFPVAGLTSFSFLLRIDDNGTLINSASKTVRNSLITVSFVSPPVLSNGSVRFAYTYELDPSMNSNSVELFLRVIGSGQGIIHNQEVPVPVVVGGLFSYQLPGLGTYKLQLRIKYPGQPDYLSSSQTVAFK
ncbi:MAG: hypothetical protein AMXMBFR48_19440 [Ignavibacteriales bacterium]